MTFKLDTPFMEVFKELNILNEDIDEIASKKFWAAAQERRIDAEAFHAAYDADLRDLGLMDVFTPEGTLVNKGVYGKIKAAKETDPSSQAVKALNKLWVLKYVDRIDFPSELAAAEAAAKAAEEDRLRREEKYRQEQEAAKLAKEEKLKEYQEILKTYISEVDPSLITTYEQATGVSVDRGITLRDEGEKPAKTWRDKPIPKFGVYYKGWDRYHPVLETKFLDKTAMVNLLTDGLIKTAEFIKYKSVAKELNKIDIFQNNDKSIRNRAQAILLGESGTVYEVSIDYQGNFMLKVDGKTVHVYMLTEPYEVIYTYTYWEDGNRNYTNCDSYSTHYYSWNSKYAVLLGKRIPTEFEKVETDLWGYIDTQRVENPAASRRPGLFSHADGIDSWAHSLVMLMESTLGHRKT